MVFIFRMQQNGCNEVIELIVQGDSKIKEEGCFYVFFLSKDRGRA